MKALNNSVISVSHRDDYRAGRHSSDVRVFCTHDEAASKYSFSGSGDRCIPRQPCGNQSRKLLLGRLILGFIRFVMTARPLSHLDCLSSTFLCGIKAQIMVCVM